MFPSAHCTQLISDAYVGLKHHKMGLLCSPICCVPFLSPLKVILEILPIRSCGSLCWPPCLSCSWLFAHLPSWLSFPARLSQTFGTYRAVSQRAPKTVSRDSKHVIPQGHASSRAVASAVGEAAPSTSSQREPPCIPLAGRKVILTRGSRLCVSKLLLQSFGLRSLG